MFSYIEVVNVASDFQWMEIVCEDVFNEEPTRLRLVVTDVSNMVSEFRRRYQSKHKVQVNFSSQILDQLNTFFQDFVHVRGYLLQDKPADELIKVAKTNVLNFQEPLKTTLKKSLASRSQIFLEEACQALEHREYDQAFRWLELAQIINPHNELAFEMKMVMLRIQGKFGECVSVLESWIEAFPQRVEPFLGLGELWLYLEQNQKAQEIFYRLLDFSPKNGMALIGLAQAQLKLGEDFMSTLMKASVWNPGFTKEMVEHGFDFRTPRPRDLVPMTLEDLAHHFKIPLKRVIGRVLRGVLPFHVHPSVDLLLFSEKELKDYYLVLKKLGLEMNTEDLSQEPLPREPEAIQLSLFDESELEPEAD